MSVQKVGCKHGDTIYESEYDKEMDQYYTYATCEKHDYYWEGYTNTSWNKWSYKGKEKDLSR